MADRECPHTGGVLCDAQVRCGVCEWNPVVTEFRQNKLRGVQPQKQPGESNTGEGKEASK